MSLFKRAGRPTPVDCLIVGLGNPGKRYEKTRHNIGQRVAEKLIADHGLGKPRARYGGAFASGRLVPGGPQVAVLIPETYMNESGRSVGPARGELQVEPENIIVVHDEIDFPFGRIETRLGGGHGGHNGLRSIKNGLGTADFKRVRIGVGRPDSTDPEIVSAWVLGKFSESAAEVDELIADATGAVMRAIDA
jgi:PTH1 family peptidyl-tRNA hydrolase